MKLRDRDDDLVQGIRLAAGDRLQGGNDLRPDHNGIDADVRHGGMGSLSTDGNDRKNIEGGHRGAFKNGKVADRHAGPIVEAEHGLDRKPVEQPLFDHHAAAPFVLLGGLKNEMHRAGKAARLGQVAGGRQKHGRVTVMTAGVHLSRILRLIGKSGLLVNVECVDVGPQGNRPRFPRRIARAGKRPDNAGLGEPAMNAETEFAQLAAHEFRRVGLLEGRLRVRVQLATPRRQLFVPLLETCPASTCEPALESLFQSARRTISEPGLRPLPPRR